MDDIEKLMAEFPELTYKFEPLMHEKQKGLIINDIVYLNPEQSHEELTGTVAEEIGHYLTSVGDIIELDTNEKRKQEQKARDIGSILVVTPFDIIDCFEAGCVSTWECAEHLGVTIKVFQQAVQYYSKKYDGIRTENGYTILFRPDGTAAVYKPFF